jgi:hypothetical protein
VTTRASGRPLYWLGVACPILGLVAYFIDFLVLKRLVVPWVVPIMATAGVFLLLLSVLRRRGVLRIITLALVILLAGFEWLFLGVFARAPAYDGPAVGERLKPFSVALADGGQFTDKTLADGTPTVLVFYRGHW